MRKPKTAKPVQERIISNDSLVVSEDTKDEAAFEPTVQPQVQSNNQTDSSDTVSTLSNSENPDQLQLNAENIDEIVANPLSKEADWLSALTAKEQKIADDKQSQQEKSSNFFSAVCGITVISLVNLWALKACCALCTTLTLQQPFVHALSIPEVAWFKPIADLFLLLMCFSFWSGVFGQFKKFLDDTLEVTLWGVLISGVCLSMKLYAQSIALVPCFLGFLFWYQIGGLIKTKCQTKVGFPTSSVLPALSIPIIVGMVLQLIALLLPQLTHYQDWQLSSIFISGFPVFLYVFVSTFLATKYTARTAAKSAVLSIFMHSPFLLALLFIMATANLAIFADVEIYPHLKLFRWLTPDLVRYFKAFSDCMQWLVIALCLTAATAGALGSLWHRLFPSESQNCKEESQKVKP